jgi:hypothetical protein
VTAAVPEIVPFITVTVPEPVVVWAVRSPFRTVPTSAAQVKSAPGIKLPNESYAAAVNARFPPAATEAGLGTTTMLATGSGMTSTVADPSTVPFVAVTKPVPEVPGAVNRPVWSTEPMSDDHWNCMPEMGLLY